MDRPGLAAERTALAWTRTSLAVLANGGLLLFRHFARTPGPVQSGIVAGSLLIAALFVLYGRRRARQVRTGGGQPPGPDALMVALLGLAVAAFGLVTAVSLTVY